MSDLCLGLWRVDGFTHESFEYGFEVSIFQFPYFSFTQFKGKVGWDWQSLPCEVRRSLENLFIQREEEEEEQYEEEEEKEDQDEREEEQDEKEEQEEDCDEEVDDMNVED